MDENIYAPLKRLTLIVVLTLTFILFLNCPSFSQMNVIYAHASFAEKIYFQLDTINSAGLESSISFVFIDFAFVSVFFARLSQN